MNCSICGSATLCSSDGEYYRCTSCGAIRTKYDYDASIYDVHYAKTYIAYADNDLNLPLNLFRLGLVSRWLRKGESLLDIGCGIGAFIRFAERYYSCTGVEPNEHALWVARRRCNSAIFGQLNGTIRAHFRAVTLFDVIEHLESPAGILQFIIDNYLQPEGVIVITTPNAGCLGDDESQVKSWKHYKPKEHIFLHTPTSLLLIAKSLNLRVLSIGMEESDIRPGNPNGDLVTMVFRRQ
jgi:2-polyprenyl-3-methyl-5-hydroxy-6-metoxy-1,4-benzoquinol methylase